LLLATVPGQCRGKVMVNGGCLMRPDQLLLIERFLDGTIYMPLWSSLVGLAIPLRSIASRLCGALKIKQRTSCS
jgi:hypothetical protein